MAIAAIAPHFDKKPALIACAFIERAGKRKLQDAHFQQNNIRKIGDSIMAGGNEAGQPTNFGAFRMRLNRNLGNGMDELSSSMHAKVYKTMAEALWQRLSSKEATRQAPSIVIE